jgi:hypothetical protein
MGNLKPGSTYIYERVDGTVYAREPGKIERTEVGWNYDPRTSDGRPLREHLMDDKLWGEIRRSAKTNPALQTELNRVIMLYHLSKKDHGQE